MTRKGGKDVGTEDSTGGLIVTQSWKLKQQWRCDLA